jgi:FkbM family methyltransferase
MANRATKDDFVTFEREPLLHLAQNGIELKNFYDVGASNCCWSWSCSEEFTNARFDLFEPLMDHLPKYQEGWKAYEQYRPNFHLHKYAMGPKCGVTQMTVYPDAVSSSMLDNNYFPPGGKRIDVEVITIDHAVEKLNLPVPQVIKIDTQGGELQVLQGATKTLPQVDLILCECWLMRGYGPSTPLLIELARWLRGFGFYLWDFGGTYRREDGRLIPQDCFFLNSRNKVSPLKGEPLATAAIPSSQQIATP